MAPKLSRSSRSEKARSTARRSRSQANASNALDDSALADDFAASIVRLIVACAIALSKPDDERVSRRLIVNVLRGTKAPPESVVVPWSGILAGTTAAWLHAVLDQTTDGGWLEAAENGSVRVAKAGTALLARADPGDLRALLPEPDALGRHPRAEAVLGELRRTLAEKEGRPAFSIFDNRTLARIAARRPAGLGELAAIPGLGTARLRKYGRAILDALSQAAEEPAKKSRAPNGRPRTKSGTKRMTH